MNQLKTISFTRNRNYGFYYCDQPNAGVCGDVGPDYPGEYVPATMVTKLLEAIKIMCDAISLQDTPLHRADPRHFEFNQGRAAIAKAEGWDTASTKDKEE